MDNDKLVENLININFNSKHWRYNLENLAIEHLGEEIFLENSIKYQCLRILESIEKKEVFRICRKLSGKNFDYNYQHKWLMKFYVLDDEIDYTRSGYGHRIEEEIFRDIKSVARNFLDQFPIEN